MKEPVEKKRNFRNIMFFIAIGLFILDAFLSIYAATPAWNNWSSLSELGRLYAIAIFAFFILSGLILSIFAIWLGEDETRIRELEKRVSNIEKTESKQ